MGCVPSKCLVAAAKAFRAAGRRHHWRRRCSGSVDLRVMKRMRDIRGGIAPHDGVARYGRDFCAAVIIGEAAFLSENEVVITARDGRNRTQTVAFDRCVVATGASAAVPPAPGLLETPHLTNGNFFNLEALPPTLGLIGAGPIGLEMAQSLQRFGCQVTVFEMAPRLLPREDATRQVGECLAEDGVAIHTGCRVLSVQGGPLAYKAPWSEYQVRAQLQNGADRTFTFAALLNATGRAPNVTGLGLDKANVSYDARSGVHTDDHYRTSNPKIYAAGDVASVYKFTHAADWQARCAVRSLSWMRGARNQDCWCRGAPTSILKSQPSAPATWTWSRRALPSIRICATSRMWIDASATVLIREDPHDEDKILLNCRAARRRPDKRADRVHAERDRSCRFSWRHAYPRRPRGGARRSAGSRPFQDGRSHRRGNCKTALADFPADAMRLTAERERVRRRADSPTLR